MKTLLGVRRPPRFIFRSVLWLLAKPRRQGGRLPGNVWCVWPSLICLAAVTSLLGGCGGPSRLPYTGPAWNSSVHAAAAFEMYDANGDGQLDKQELAKCPGLLFGLEVVDASRDGMIDELELRQQIESFRSMRDELLPVNVQLTLDGRPLAGATVEIVGDPFTKDVLPSASGVTDATGKAVLEVEGMESPGVPAGVYRLSVVKSNGGSEMLPSRYNTETVLGLLVSPDATSSVAFPRFALRGR